MLHDLFPVAGASGTGLLMCGISTARHRAGLKAALPLRDLKWCCWLGTSCEHTPVGYGHFGHPAPAHKEAIRHHTTWHVRLGPWRPICPAGWHQEGFADRSGAAVLGNGYTQGQDLAAPDWLYRAAADFIPGRVGLHIFQAMPASIRCQAILAALSGKGVTMLCSHDLLFYRDGNLAALSRQDDSTFENKFHFVGGSDHA